MLPEPIALIGGVDDYGVVSETLRIEIIQDSLQVVVIASDAADVFVHHVLVSHAYFVSVAGGIVLPHLIERGVLEVAIVVVRSAFATFAPGMGHVEFRAGEEQPLQSRVGLANIFVKVSWLGNGDIG